MKRPKKIRRQKPIAGGREALPACVLKEIHQKVESIAWEHGVSRSFVIATVLADAFGIDEQERYYGTVSKVVPIRRRA